MYVKPDYVSVGSACGVKCWKRNVMEIPTVVGWKCPTPTGALAETPGETKRTGTQSRCYPTEGVLEEWEAVTER
jgi:hypothetical protein